MKKYIWVIVLLAAAGIGRAQEVQYPLQKQLHKHQYAQAEKAIRKQLQKDSADVMYLYSASMLYLQRRYSAYSLDTAYMYAGRAYEAYNTCTDKQIKSLARKGITDLAIQGVIDTIAYRDVNRIKPLHSEAEYNKWLAHYTLASPYLVRRITQYRNTAAYQAADTACTAEAYMAFVERYPQADEVPQAKQRILQIHYLQAEKANTIEAYESFIKTYPKSDKVRDAQAHIHSIAYAQALEQHSSKAITEFIRKYPKAEQIEAAQKSLQKIAYLEADAAHTYQAYTRYIAAYPDAPYVPEAKCRAAVLSGSVEQIEKVLPIAKGTVRDTCIYHLHKHYITLPDVAKIKWLYAQYADILPGDIKSRYEQIYALDDSVSVPLFISTVAPYRAASVALEQWVDTMAVRGWAKALEEVRAYAPLFGEDEAFGRIYARVADRAAAEEARLAEEARIAEEKRVAEEARVAEEKRLAEEKRIAEEKRVAEEAKLKAREEELNAKEDELKAREAELKAKEAAEQKAKEEAEQKAKEAPVIQPDEGEGEM